MKRFFVSTLMLSLLVLGACTQKRKQIFAQGQGTNLDSIQLWDHQFTDIETGEVIAIPPTTNAQDGVTISDRMKDMNHYNLVQINVQDERFKTLIGNPPFRGKPKTKGTYQAEFKLTDNYLKIMKVAKKEDLPFEEHFYIEDTLKDGRVAIPLVGYKIKAYYRIEPQKTDDDQNSHHLIEVEEEDPTKATHVRIDWGSREIFEPVKKTDLFPAELFFTQNKQTQEFKPYEWYYSETIIEKSLSDEKTRIGDILTRTEKSKLSPASKVMFIPREGELRVVNVARDERLSRDQIQHSADLNSEAALILPVKWKDYRTKSEGSNLSFKGEEVEERKWSQREFFVADFPSIQSAAIADGKTRLLDIEVDQNYLSFTVMNLVGNQGRKIRYSFLRADQGRLPYQSKVSDEKDRTTFGYYTTQKPFVYNWEYYTKNDFRKRVFMNRMNPDQKEIVFHLSTDSPKWLEDVTEMAVQAWDRTFEQALGKGVIRIRLSPERVTLGDIRYNVIHIVDTLSQDSLLGYGPTIADPETGEIIAASTNVYVNSIQAYAASSIRQYMIDRLEGRLNTKDLTGVILAESLPAHSTSLSPESLANTLALKDLSYLEKSAKKLQAFGKMESRECTYADQSAFSSNDRDIARYCPKIDEIIQGKKSLSFLDKNAEQNWESLWDSSKEAILECSKKITRGKMLSTLTHEIGHNFGLRHNFLGSYDKKNFKEMQTIFGEKVIAHSSSIMEYTSWDEDRLTETGPYDIAAIRFGYGNKVELNDGSMIDVGINSIESALNAAKKKSSDLKPYLYCTDEDEFYGTSALCRSSDSGTSPAEIAQFYISQYRRLETLFRLRRARPDISPSAKLAINIYDGIFTPLRQIYDEWRLHLAEYVKRSNRYLVDYSNASYSNVLEGMKNDPQFGSLYAEYHDAAEQIYSFLKDVAYGYDQYCLIEDNGETRVTEFLTLRDMISEATRGSVMIRSCAEAQSSPELAKVLNTQSPKVVSEIGYPVKSYRYTKIENSNDVSMDVFGNADIRSYAFVALTYRYPSYQNFLNEFTPSPLDEPHHFKDLGETLLNRLVSGVDFSKYKLKAQPLFNSEQDILRDAAKTLKYGLIVPGDKYASTDTAATNKRYTMFTVYRPVQGDNPQSLSSVLTVNQRMVYAGLSSNQVLANNLIRRYQEVESMLSASPISEQQVAASLSEINQKLPSSTSLDQYTLKNFIDLANALSSASEENEWMVCLKGKVNAIAQIDEVTEKILPDFKKAKEQGTDALNTFMQTRLQTVVQNILFTKENLSSSAGPALAACIQSQNESVTKTQRFKKDLEAQKSLILNVLEMYAE